MPLQGMGGVEIVAGPLASILQELTVVGDDHACMVTDIRADPLTEADPRAHREKASSKLSLILGLMVSTNRCIIGSVKRNVIGHSHEQCPLSKLRKSVSRAENLQSERTYKRS